MNLDIKIVNVNTDPRPGEIAPISEADAGALGYLGGVAIERKHAASLIVNCYNHNIVGANVSDLSYYCRGESCDTLETGMFNLIKLAAYIEAQEIYGDEFVNLLIEKWEFRKK